MLSVIEENLVAVRRIAQEQQNRIAAEINSAVDALNAAKGLAAMAFETAEAKRKEAERLEAQARREIDTAISNCQAVLIGIMQQLDDGQMVTGTDTPAPARRGKPKLIRAAGGDA